jgi:hypothetical protein
VLDGLPPLASAAEPVVRRGEHRGDTGS